MTPRRRGAGLPPGSPAGGYSFLEVVIALTLAAIVFSLVGSLLIASLGAWRRGQDLRAAQAYATILVDTIGRDVRRASRTTGVSLHPSIWVADGVPMLAISAVAGPEPSGASILYVYRRDRREVVRQTLTAGPDGQSQAVQERLVAGGVAALAVHETSGGVTVEAEVRLGRATARARGTSAPQNP